MSAEAPNPRPSPQSKDGVFSLEDLDKIIEAEDPNFKSEMENIKSTQLEDTTAVESLQVVSEDDISKEEETEKTRKQKIIDFVTLPWRRLTGFLKLKKIALKNRMSLLGDSTKQFFRHELPERARLFKAKIIKAFHWLANQWQAFKKLTAIQKTAIFATLVLVVGAIMLLSRTITGGWLPRYVDPLPRSFLAEATYKGRVTNKEDMQLLFQAFPEVEFNVLLGKVIVNLKPDAESTNNPMGTFEFFVAVDSQDTAVEVKDREREILDIVQRTLEDFSYSQARTELGKNLMKGAIRDRLNQILNQGQVMRLYINTFVITP